MTAPNHPASRDPAEIEREIRNTQDEMSQTVDQIGAKLTPRNVINALLDEAEEKGIDGRFLLDGARSNPLALGMIALGGLWLVSDSDARLSSLKPQIFKKGSAGDPHDDHRRYVEHMSRYEPQPGEEPAAYRRRRDQARATYFMLEQRHDEDETRFRDRLDQATEKLRERRDSLLESARHLGETAGHSAQSAAYKTIEAYVSNPVAGGLVAALAGALAGSFTPVTRTEENQVGELGSKALDAVEAEASHLAKGARAQKEELVHTAETKLDPDRGKGSSASRADAGPPSTSRSA